MRKVIKYHTQAVWLLEIDLKFRADHNRIKRYPEEFDNTVFIICSDHGHKYVDPFKIVRPYDDVFRCMTDGLFYSEVMKYGRAMKSRQSDDTYSYSEFIEDFWESGIKIAVNGPMAQIYLLDNLLDDYYSLMQPLLANLCSNWGIGINTKSIYATDDAGRLGYANVDWAYMILAKSRGGLYYPLQVNIVEDVDNDGRILYNKFKYVLSEINNSKIDHIAKMTNTMLNNDKTSGHILILLNHEDGWQFADSQPHASTFSIPFTDIKDLRIPLSESFNSKSTHGSINTMDVPLTFVGKCIPQSSIIKRANVVDIVPTILSILGVPVPTHLDGDTLLDNNLRFSRSIKRAARNLGYTGSPIEIQSLAGRIGISLPFSLQDLYDHTGLSG